MLNKYKLIFNVNNKLFIQNEHLPHQDNELLIKIKIGNVINDSLNHNQDKKLLLFHNKSLINLNNLSLSLWLRLIKLTMLPVANHYYT